MIKHNIQSVQTQIIDANKNYGRSSDEVVLLAVSKTRTANEISEAVDAGLRRFGENYLQEALEKINALKDLNLEWHFIGPIQANKTQGIAENFDWAQSVDRVKIAQRLNEKRPESLPPLNICIQVNVSEEASKSGISINEVNNFAAELKSLDRLKLRGLMTIPAVEKDFEKQRASFHRLRLAYEQLREQGYDVDTLSMGMSDDFVAAIAEGSTMLRLGSAIFGERSKQ